MKEFLKCLIVRYGLAVMEFGFLFFLSVLLGMMTGGIIAVFLIFIYEISKG